MESSLVGRGRLSMRWWLALVFAIIVTVMALAVSEVLTIRSENAFRGRAKELAAGTTVTAAAAITNMQRQVGLAAAVGKASGDRGIALFLFDRHGGLLTPSRSNGVSLSSVADVRLAVATALGGRRLVRSDNGDRRIVVTLPMKAGSAAALLSVAARPDLVAAGNILRGQRVWAILAAIGVGALVGLAVAILITSRLRRIARAAARISGGSFDEPLVAMFPDELGELAATVDTMRLRLRESFATLEAERDRLRSLLEQLQEGVIAVDHDLKIAFANSRAALIFGRRAVQPGVDLPDPWPALSLRSLASSLLEPHGRLVNERVAPDSERTFSVVGIPLRASSDSALLVISDVTADDRRERAEREFVANAAHELRTPLAAIASAIEVLQGGAKADPTERDRFLALIERQSNRLTRLVRSLLMLARTQTRTEQLRLESVDVERLLHALSEEVTQGGQATVEVSCDHGLTALAHPDLLAQAVGNLLTNALKHGVGGKVLLSGSRVGGDRVRIEVRDFGRGIAESERERVFDRFYRGSSETPDSFGLGLPIVREIAGALNGNVELEAADEGGTRASITVAATEDRR